VIRVPRPAGHFTGRRVCLQAGWCSEQRSLTHGLSSGRRLSVYSIVRYTYYSLQSAFEEGAKAFLCGTWVSRGAGATGCICE